MAGQGIRWDMIVLGAGIAAMMAWPLLAPGSLPSEAFLACDATGGVWDAAREACLPADSPLSGAAL